MLIAFFVLLAGTACSKDSESKEQEFDKIPSKSGPKSNEGSLPKTGPSAKNSSSGKIPDLEKICDSFPAKSLSTIVGKTLKFSRQTTRSKEEVFCHYNEAGSDSKVRAAILVNCDKDALDMERHVKNMKFAGKKDFAMVEGLGRGGARGFMEAGNTDLLMFIHDKVDCRIQVSTNHLESDVLPSFGDFVYGVFAK